MTKTYEDYINERKIRLKELSKYSKQELLSMFVRHVKIHSLSLRDSKEDLKYALLDAELPVPKKVIQAHREMEEQNIPGYIKI